jgi:hypothetical protein
VTIKTKLQSNQMTQRLVLGVGGTVANTLTAAGTNQGTAYAMSIDDMQLFTTVGSGTGAIFAQAYSPNDSVTIINNGAHDLSIYPATGGGVNGGTANAAGVVPAGFISQWQTTDGLNWWFIGAKGGYTIGLWGP